jgi:hypothetical protein
VYTEVEDRQKPIQSWGYGATISAIQVSGIEVTTDKNVK